MMTQAVLTKQIISHLYRTMWEIREFELAASHHYKEGQLPGFIHLSLGQEACAAGACTALSDGDYITSNHRGHGHCLAKGASPRLMMAELFAKREGYSKGRGGSMHIADVSKGVLGANGIVGQSMGLGVGAALSLQVGRKPYCVIAFFGEGASGTGIAHEAMNMAAIWKLPIVFFCESNGYAELSAYSTHVSIEKLATRAVSYGFPGLTVDGEDVVAIYQAVSEAAMRARQGGGPTLIEAKARRWHGHYEGDPQVYKSKEQREGSSDFDPIARFEELIPRLCDMSREEAQLLKTQAQATIKDAVAWASTLSEPGTEAILEDVYAD